MWKRWQCQATRASIVCSVLMAMHLLTCCKRAPRNHPKWDIRCCVAIHSMKRRELLWYHRVLRRYIRYYSSLNAIYHYFLSLTDLQSRQYIQRILNQISFIFLFAFIYFWYVIFENQLKSFTIFLDLLARRHSMPANCITGTSPGQSSDLATVTKKRS